MVQSVDGDPGVNSEGIELWQFYPNQLNSTKINKDSDSNSSSVELLARDLPVRVVGRLAVGDARTSEIGEACQRMKRVLVR